MPLFSVFQRSSGSKAMQGKRTRQATPSNAVYEVICGLFSLPCNEEVWLEMYENGSEARMERIEPKALLEALGGEYHYVKDRRIGYATVCRGDRELAFVDFAPAWIMVPLQVKWSWLLFGRDWVPFTVDMGEHIGSKADVFRLRWQRAGFTVASEMISSCHAPVSDPGVDYPAGEIQAELHPSTLQEAVDAFRFIASEPTELWIHREEGE